MLFVESLYWLALCIYHEARGEPFDGQLAVAHVIMNRSQEHGVSVKEIITIPHQFSWVGDDIPDDVVNHSAFIRCLCAAMMARDERLQGKSLEGANHYFADYISPPDWSKDMKFIVKIGRHLFYKG